MYERVCVCVYIYIYISFWILNYMQKKLGLTETEWYLLEYEAKRHHIHLLV